MLPCQVCDYKDGRYPHYFEVHSPMGNMRLRAEDAAGKDAWVTSLQKQARVSTIEAIADC